MSEKVLVFVCRHSALNKIGCDECNQQDDCDLSPTYVTQEEYDAHFK